MSAVREVAPSSDGLEIAREWEDAIFVVHRQTHPTVISVIHMHAPAQPDDVALDLKQAAPDPALTLVTAAKAKPNALLVPWVSDYSDPRHLPWHFKNVSSVPSSSRVSPGDREEYTDLRYEGGTGGPEDGPPLSSAIIDGGFGFHLGEPVVIDSLPPPVRGTTPQLFPLILAASGDYLLLSTRTATPKDKLGQSERVFVQDRAKHRWSTRTIEGNWSEGRVFGDWFATLVRMANSENKVSPGRQNERSVQTDRLPNVQLEYQTWAGRYYWMPGVLTLQNLADGRKIRIETGQEDSEILRVEGDSVLYRVNDSIYQARIDGEQLKDTALVVKDEDVPEIHWAFWSK